jgi:hypothetical protein
MSTQRHNTPIAQTMEFTAEDLAQNRRGQVSPMQLQKLAVMRDMFVSDLHDTPPLHIPSVTRLIVIAVLAGILHLLGVLDRLQHWLGAGYHPLLLGGGLLLLEWLVWDQFRYAAVRRLLPGMLDDMIQTPALYSVTGEAGLAVEELPTETNYWLTIGDQRFALTTRAANVFRAGRVYRVYYTPFADATILLSAEWLKDTTR